MLGMVTLFHSNCGFEFEFERVTAVYYSSLVPCIVYSECEIRGKKVLLQLSFVTGLVCVRF